MAFLNKERKIFGGLLIGGIVAYFIYRNMGQPPATTSTTTSSFTGRQLFNNADGGCKDCKNCKGCGGNNMANFNNENETNPASDNSPCNKLMNELSKIQDALAKSYNYRPSDITLLKNQEMQLLGLLQKYNCQ